MVVMDASIVDASEAPFDVFARYTSQVEGDLRNCSNLVTTRFAIRELFRGLNSRNPIRRAADQFRKRICHTDTIEGYAELEAYLLRTAPKTVVNYFKEDSHSAVRIAALAFASRVPRTAFVSSDRKLNDFILGTIDGIVHGKASGFPCAINTIDVYSFIQKQGGYVLRSEDLAYARQHRE